MVITLTGVSGSGKSTLAKILIEKYGFKKPIQFTTRKPRTDAELDEYVFLDKPTFFLKANNGDFLEFARYGTEFYAISKFLPEGNVVMVVDPVGQKIVEKYCKENAIRYRSFFIDIDEDTMVDRLGMKRRETVKVIEERKKDFLSFSPIGFGVVIDGTPEIEVVERRMVAELKKAGVIH